MSQNFLTVEMIAKEALLRLRNNLVMRQLVYNNHSNEFANVGDTIQVRKPATFTANEWAGSTSTQNIVEDNVLVKLDKVADVSVNVTAKELALNIQDFGFQIVEGAMQALAQKIDEDIMGLYKYIPYRGTGGTPGSLPNALACVADARATLNTQKVPFSNRYMVLSPATEANLLVLDAIAGAEKSGSTQALREANMGRIMGFDMYMSQNVMSHSRGTWESQSPQVSGTPDAGSTTWTVKNLTQSNHSINVGDMFTINQFDKTYTVVGKPVTASEASSTTHEIDVWPPLEAAGVDGAAITVLANHVANLAFHKHAFAFVNRPLALPMGGAQGAVENFEGLSVRVTMGYEMSEKRNNISFDILYGVKTLQPELAMRLWRK